MNFPHCPNELVHLAVQVELTKPEIIICITISISAIGADTPLVYNWLSLGRRWSAISSLVPPCSVPLWPLNVCQEEFVSSWGIEVAGSTFFVIGNALCRVGFYPTPAGLPTFAFTLIFGWGGNGWVNMPATMTGVGSNCSGS